MRRRPSARQEPTVLSGVLITGLERTLRGEPIVKSARRRLTALGYIERAGFDQFSKLTPTGLRALRYGDRTIENRNAASAMSAGTAETEGLGAKPASAIGESRDAQPESTS